MNVATAEFIKVLERKIQERVNHPIIIQKIRKANPVKIPIEERVRENRFCEYMVVTSPLFSACCALMAKKMAGMVQNRPTHAPQKNTTKLAIMA